MNKKILLVSELFQDLELMKNWFDDDCRIKGLGSYSAVPKVILSEMPDAIVLRIRDSNDFFTVYMAVRSMKSGKNIPIIAAAENDLRTALNTNVALKNALLINSAINSGSIKKIISDFLK